MKEINQILLDLRRRIFKPVYFLSGEEPYYIDLVSDHIERHALEEADKEFNQDVVYGKDTDLPSVIALAKQFPMMSDYKVVIVKEAQNLRELSKTAAEDDEQAPGTTSGKTEKNKSTGSAQAQLIAYLQQPLQSTVLVFCYKYKTIDKRSAVAKALQKHAVFVETKKLYDNQVPDWISAYIKEQKRAVGPRAAAMLAEFIGNDLSRISGEINKLLITVKEGEEITTAMVQENIGVSREYNVFELQEALAARDVLKANRIVSHFASNEKDNPAPMVLASLYNYFVKLYKFHGLTEKSKGAIAAALGVNPYFADSYARAAGNYPPGKLAAIFGALKECDLKSKGVGNPSVPSGELLKELVFKILHDV